MTGIYPDQVIIPMYGLAMDDQNRGYLLVRIVGSILYPDKSYTGELIYDNSWKSPILDA